MAVDVAPSPVMREIARIATAKGYTLGRLAQELNKITGNSLSTINVSRHFDTEQPREDTLGSYAKVLGIPGQYLHLLRSSPLPRPLAHAATARACRSLLLRAHEFKPEEVDEIIGRMKAADEGERARIGSAFWLSEFREVFGVVDDELLQYQVFQLRFGQPLTSFAAALLPQNNLFKAARDRVDLRLAKLWVPLGWLFHGDAADDIDKVIDFVVRLLKSRSIDTREMQAELERFKTHFKNALIIPVGSIAEAMSPFGEDIPSQNTPNTSRLKGERKRGKT